jgi:hypothetical protein
MNKTIFLLHCHFRSRNWTIGFFCSLCQSKKRKRGWKCCLAELQVVKLFVVGGITTIATEIVHQNVFTVRVVFEWVDSFRSWWSYCLGTRQSLSVVMFFRRSESVPSYRRVCRVPTGIWIVCSQGLALTNVASSTLLIA